MGDMKIQPFTPREVEWPSGQSAGLWVGRPGFESWMGHYVVALSKSLHSPCFVFSDKTLSRRSRLLQGLG